MWADGKFSWVFADDWTRELCYLPETLVTDVKLTNENLGIEIVCNDTVASHENIFLRRVRVRNLRDAERKIRVFLHHDFRIYENKVGDTAFYDPESFSLVHYKKHRYFLINTAPHFDVFSTGRKAFGEQEGTWRDAEDGILSGGAITEGSVDSTVGVYLYLEPHGEQEFYYWICAGFSHDEVIKLNRHVHEQTPQQYLNYTENYWRVWVNKNGQDFADLSAEIVGLFKRSLLIIRTQTDNDGAILAANDSDVTERATDHYSYLWTRDGAFVANALDLAGYPFLTRKFFELCAKIIHDDGYFLQKYNSDGTVASGWHAAWDVWGQKKLLPIQEDETALVIWALWEHYDKFREIEFVRKFYHSLITKAADFMVSFRHAATGLPAPSWNLWEDRRGIHTFTCAAVVGGLRAAANFARLFGETERAAIYESAATEIVHAMREHLYSREHGRFLRSLHFHGDDFYEPEATVDASIFAAFYFGAFSPNDEMIENSMRAVGETLWTAGDIGGVARFENDGYMRAEDLPSNAWFICTLWLADYYIARAETREDLKKALKILDWVTQHALPSGVLAEQVHPATGEPVSVAPLTWSHSTFVATVMNYRRKLSLISEKK